MVSAGKCTKLLNALFASLCILANCCEIEAKDVFPWTKSNDEVMYVHDPVVGDNVVATSCLGTDAEVKCSVALGRIPTVTGKNEGLKPIKECSFNDRTNSQWSSESWKLVAAQTRGTSHATNYIDKPFVAALDDDRIVLGWIERASRLPTYRLRTRNVRFSDCFVTETLLQLGFQLGPAFVNVLKDASADAGYRVIAGNFKDACGGKMCMMRVDGEGGFDGVFNDYPQIVNVVLGRLKWSLDEPRDLRAPHAHTVQMSLNAKIGADLRIRSKVWLGEYHGIGVDKYLRYPVSMKDFDISFEISDRGNPLLSVCWFDATWVTCDQHDIPSRGYRNLRARLKKVAVHQQVAVKGLADRGALVAVIGEKGNFFEVTHFNNAGKKQGFLRRDFDGCDATLANSRVKATIEEIRGADGRYCIKEICENTDIARLQRFDFDSSYNCFLLTDVIQDVYDEDK